MREQSPQKEPEKEILLTTTPASDCDLDDPELFTSKKHLIAKVTPLSLVSVL
jgi:hypothetical protein